MTQAEWLDEARRNAADLADLIDSYHPGSVLVEHETYAISAPAAEAACEIVRTQIADEERAETMSPRARFEAALAAGDIGTICSLLDGAWFGVPESRSCWRIRGFSEAVDLLDDPPEDE